MAHGHKPDVHPLAGGMAQPNTTPAKEHKVKDGKVPAAPSTVKQGTRVKPV